MVAASDAMDARLKAGELLRSYWACPGDQLEVLEEEEEQIRDFYVDVQAAEPNDVASLVGMTLLAFAKLRAHIVHRYSPPLDWCEDAMWRRVWHPDKTRRPTELKGTDKASSALAEDAVEAARIALEQQPNNNLAAFALARSLEWLGDRSAAVTAYGEALAVDPYDEAARSRLTILKGESIADAPVRPAPGDRLSTWYPHGFYVVELTEPVNNSGDVSGVLALLNDPDSARSLADGYLQDRLGEVGEDEGFAERLEEVTLTVWTNLQGARLLAMDLREALCPTPDGGQIIDWSQVAMADPLIEPLPTGCPVRWRGELLFFGATEILW
ncbi:hypothetical protein ITP53_04235 [Nonomuraea sp. K274]|uniref:Tetratricopeptide repeat protein n=1 Tax=Nonomuraea cypriaca TaxID=1187855 RepID=A0A931EZ98_9ACTN|nr:hypothetical protein [Nonomuraea cypriaca]MBF8184958.1 hypothetical protein [Nonomuraea cypriaca]